MFNIEVYRISMTGYSTHYTAAMCLSSELVLEKIPQSPTSDWLFDIPPESNSPNELGVPLPPTAVFSRDTIDWKAVEKIFIKRPKLAKSVIGHGDSGFGKVAFLASLNETILSKAHCTFQYESQSYFATDCQRVLTKCSLTFNFPDGASLNIVGLSTKKWLARGVALLQLFPILEEKELLDDLLPLISPKWVAKTEEKLSHNVQTTEIQSVIPIVPAETKSIPDAPLTPKEEQPVELKSKSAKNPKELTPNHLVTREVFNYAAKYLYIPEYTVTSQTVSKKEHSDNPVTSKKLTTPKTSFTVTISLPEHSIHATATSFDLPLTEAMACTEFKVQAEKHHTANSIPSHSSEGPIILTTANVRNFMDFYNDYNDKLVIRIKRKGEIFKSQAFTRDSNTAALETLGPAIERSSSRDLETLTLLVAAVTLAKQRPQLLLNYLEKMNARSGRYVGKALPMELELHQSSLELMQRTVETTTKLNLSTLPTGECKDHDVSPLVDYHKPRLEYSYDREVEQRSRGLSKWSSQRSHKPKYSKLLPLNQNPSEVFNHIENNQFCILIGKTGSGKTTQLSQIILDDYIRTKRGGECRVICTQPRRIAAKSVAERVAEERGQELGDQVGYKIGFDAKLPNSCGSITYCTTGIILQQLTHHPDAILDNTSHLIIDEVHERDLDIDFLLTMVRKLVKERIEAGKPTPKVCLMSATADAEMLQGYFAFKDGTREITCPVMHVEGRAFPVEKYYLENIMDTFRETYPTGHTIWDLLDSNKNKTYLKSEERIKKTNLVVDVENEQSASAIKWDSHDDDPDSLQKQMAMDTLEGQVPTDLAAIVIAHIASTTDDGAILVFLPGIRGINIIEKILKAQDIFNLNFNDENKFKILKLHSSTADQHQEVFEPVSPGCRKIILATNVAETSITIDDIRYVVDTGKHKENNFHQLLRIWSLPCKWISKSSVKQRSGRAGRVQSGSYYGLFSKRRYDSLRATPRPGMSRVDLQSTCLAVNILGYNESIQDFLASAPEPPSPKAIQSSIEGLQTLGALTSTEKITPLGRIMGTLPLRPTLGKMVILGIIFRCLDSMIILAAFDNITFHVRPLDMEEESDAAMRGFARTSKSDHVAMLNAFRALRHLEEVDGREVMTSFAHQKFLSVANYDTVKRNISLIQQALRRNGLVVNRKTQGVAELGTKYGGEILNENSDQDELIRALLVQGLYPHIGAWNNHETKYQIVANERVLIDIHPSSINHPLQRPNLKVEGIASPSKNNARLLSFDKLILLSNKNLVMQRTTAVTPFMLSLFGGTLNRSADNAGQVEVDEWLPFDVRSTDKLRGAEGVAGQTLVRFNKALRQLENISFNDLANGEYVVDNELSHDFAKALKNILITEQDIDRLAEENELDLAMDLRKFWNRSESPLDKIPPKESKEIVPKFSLLEETQHDEDSYGSFLELVESALEGPSITKLYSEAASSSSQAESQPVMEDTVTKESDGVESKNPGNSIPSRFKPLPKLPNKHRNTGNASPENHLDNSKPPPGKKPKSKKINHLLHNIFKGL
ncbi:putative atp-dependent rna helicase dhx36 protein [Botrytis fragariae]|uniref:RNA helicase n=1 Tax=Botrytis fragariae TaxID=1964551 RepID=A0A8H6ATH7_9HELO|nr:putative atp-dependent rna helicase dhx36 protein [Botrytis fragariae]KAF5873160.1 putative atp-dependent rna helicase dhx36 protein [Botrytis fragariae]